MTEVIARSYSYVMSTSKALHGLRRRIIGYLPLFLPSPPLIVAFCFHHHLLGVLLPACFSALSVGLLHILLPTLTTYREVNPKKEMRNCRHQV